MSSASSWTEADFEQMSWHDNHVHALQIESGGEHGTGTLTSGRRQFDDESADRAVRPLAIAAAVVAWLAACASMPRKTIDAIVERYHAAGTFSGAVLVGRGDTIVYQRAVGLADEAWNVPNTLDTRFQIGSLTKQFTGALIYELAQQKRIDLDQPLSQYLPEYRADVAQAVTIRQLLGHSAGVPDFVRRPDIMQLLKQPATPAE